MSEEATKAMVPVAETPRRFATVQDPIPVMDSDRFSQMQRIASAMAHGSLVPEALTHAKTKGQTELQPLGYDTVLANCFLVVNQAVRWGMDPFAVAQCVSVVHGKLCYEGKLVAAVLDVKLGIKLNYQFGKWDKVKSITDLSEEGTGDDLAVRVSETMPDGTMGRFVDGYVGGWKTTGSGSPWGNSANHRRQLRYRGAREWSRAHESGVMLGVYTEDELADLAEDARARRAQPVGSGVAARLSAAQPAGVDTETIHREINGKQPEQTDEPQNPTKDTPKEGQNPRTEGAPADRNGPDAGASTSVEAGAEPKPGLGSAPASSPKDGEREAAGGSAPAGGSPYDFKDYSTELAKASVVKSLKAFDATYRNKNGWTTEEPARETLRKIYQIHLDRVNSKLNPKDVHAALQELDAI